MIIMNKTTYELKKKELEILKEKYKNNPTIMERLRKSESVLERVRLV